MAENYDIQKKEQQLTELIGKQAANMQKGLERTDAEVKRIEEQYKSELAAATAEIAELKKAVLAQKTQEVTRRPEFKSINVGLKGFLKMQSGQELNAEEKSALADMEQKAMVTTNGPRAGFLKLPPTMASMILDTNLAEISPIRQLARVEAIGGDEYHQITQTGRVTAGWTAEAGTRSASTTQAYGVEKIPVHEQYAYDSATYRMLDDSNFDLAASLSVSAATNFAALEGTAFVTGNGAVKPAGFTANASVLANYIAQGEAATITNGDAIRKLWLKPKSQYRPRVVYGMNATTLATIYNLTDSAGQYVFQMMPDAPMGTIQGKRIIELPDMPDIGAGTYPIVCADFATGYVIVDKMTDWGIIVDPYSAKTSGAVEYLFRRYVGGAVVVPEAFAVLKVAAS